MRRALVLVPMLAAASLWGCQSYNFNPVGHCVIQPGSTQHSLGNIATADILFVVDDSGSMGPKQQALAANFDTFINELNQTNTDRVNAGLEPLDFHIAITTSSIFSNYGDSGAKCVANAGKQQCCTGMTTCADDASCQPDAALGQACATETNGRCVANYVGSPFQMKRQCCAMPTNAGLCQDSAGCWAGWNCGTFVTTYPNPIGAAIGCSAGLATAGAPYPAGDFVAANGNPKVLHFTKSLYKDPVTGQVNIDTSAIATLVSQFKQNINVGTCGSGQEQHLESARMAIQKALDGKQAGVVPNTADGWPHQGARLVVVWVGDEDDCSSPDDPTKALVDLNQGDPGQDYCFYQSVNQDQETSPAGYGGGLLVSVSEYADYFKGLQRPFGAAFVVSARKCTDGSYSPQDLNTAPTCSVDTSVTCDTSLFQAAGVRFLKLASLFQTESIVVSDALVEGSVCESFGPTLGNIADLVKPPNSLKLDTQPAAGDVTVLRIASADGTTRKTCNGPAPAGGPTDGMDWWFIASCAPGVPTTPTIPTQCVYINHATRNCEANPGEVYSAEYLGRVPAEGCKAVDDCVTALGGKATDWNCYSPSGPTSDQNRGTCLCQGG